MFCFGGCVKRRWKRGGFRKMYQCRTLPTKGSYWLSIYSIFSHVFFFVSVHFNHCCLNLIETWKWFHILLLKTKMMEKISVLNWNKICSYNLVIESFSFLFKFVDADVFLLFCWLAFKCPFSLRLRVNWRKRNACMSCVIRFFTSWGHGRIRQCLWRTVDDFKDL